MRTQIQIIIILTLLFCSCGQAPKKEPINTSDSVSTNPISSNPVDTSIKDFTVFWTAFRQAILTNDTAIILSLTKFPIETRGPMDSDPIVKYSRDNFIKIFDLYLGQGSGLEEGSELDYIKKINVPEKRDYWKEGARIGNLEFVFTDRAWTLSFIYLIPQTIDEINKNGW